jgi:hypothetical protein
VKSSSSTKTLLAPLLVLSALGIVHSYRFKSPVRGPLASVMMSSTASGLPNSVTRPSALAAVPFALEMPRTPERAYIALAQAMLIQALEKVLASPEASSLALKPRRSAVRSLQRVSCCQAGSFRAHLCPQLPLSMEFAAHTGPAAPTNIPKAFASGQHERGRPGPRERGRATEQ